MSLMSEDRLSANLPRPRTVLCSPFLTLITTYLVERAGRRDLRPDRAFTTLLCTSSNQRGVFGGVELQRYTAIRAVHSLSTWVGDMFVTRRRESVLP